MKHSTFSWGNQVCCSTSAESISKAFKAMALIAFLFLWGGIGLFAQSPSLSITGLNNYNAPANNPGGYAQLPSGYVDCGSVNEGDWTYSAMSNSEFGFGPKTAYFQESPSGCTNSIWTGGYLGGTPHSLMAQVSFAVPANGALLSFEYLSALMDVENDGLDYSFIKINGEPFFTLYHVASNNTNDFVDATINISEFAGQTITISAGNVTSQDNLQGNVLFGCFTVLCNDCTPALAMTCASNVTVECGQEGNLELTGSPVLDITECDDMMAVSLNFSDLIISETACNKVIVRTWVATYGDLTETCTQTITVVDTTAPVISGVEPVVTVECLENVPGPAEASAIDACSGATSVESFTSNTGEIISHCDLSTAFGPGPDWAIWLPTLYQLGYSASSQFNFVGSGSFDQYNDGSAHLYGTVANNINPAQQFQVDFWFDNASDWATWSSMGRSYKDDLNCAQAGNLYMDWTYYEMVNDFSTLTGMGDYAGDVLYFQHMPSNYYFGMQIGQGANNKNCGFGLSTWFYFNGFMDGNYVTGHGDANTDASCEPVNEQDCVHNTEFTFLYRAQDACGRASIVSQQIIVDDNTAPTFVDCPESITIECGQEIPAVASPNAVDNCTGDVVVAFVGEELAGNQCSNTITRTWSAIDICGNRSNCVQVITVVDTTAPSFDSTPDSEVTYECSSVVAPAVLTATDACQGVVPVQYEEAIIEGECAGQYTINRHWWTSDNCQNTTHFYQTVNVIDTTGPVFDEYPFYTQILCENLPAILTATDACGTATVEVTFEQLNSGGCLGVLHRIYTATDDCGNTTTTEQYITIVDYTNPTIYGVGEEMSVECSDVEAGEEFIFGAGDVYATDNCGGEVSINYSEEVVATDDNCPNSYDVIRTWVAIDYCENDTMASQLVHIIDTTAPSFDEYTAEQSVSCELEIPAASVVVSDLCGAASWTHVDVRIDGSCDQTYTIERTLTAVDACGNENTLVTYIYVYDETAPSFDENAVAEISIECGQDIPYIEPASTDNCGEVVTTHNDVTVEESDCFTLIQRTFTATDECGNSNNFVQFVYITDTTAPAFDQYALELDRPCDDYSGIYITATDVCNNFEITFTEEIVSGSCAGRIIREYTATDVCGNSSTATQVITLIDTVSPVASFVPENQIVECGSAYEMANATFTDNCDDSLEPELNVETTFEGCNTILTYTWTVVDHCFNEASVSSTITIVDTTAPFWDFVPADVTINCDEEIPAIVMAQASDVCDDQVDVAVTEMTTAGECANEQTISRLYRAFDDCGNEIMAIQYVYVVDVTAPSMEGQSEVIVECGSEIPEVAPTATDACGDVTISFVDGEISSNAVCGDYDTYLAGHYGNAANAGGQYLLNNFNTAFPNGLTIGCGGNTMSFTSAQALINYLPVGGTPSLMSGPSINPSPATNGLANQLITAILNVTFDQSDASFSSSYYNSGDLIFANGLFAGLTVNEVIQIGNNHIGGCSSEYTLVQVRDAIRVFNRAYSNNSNTGSAAFICEASQSTSCDQSFVRTWTATDVCGNSSTFEQVISIVDTTAPSVEGEVELNRPCDDYSGIYINYSDVCHDVTVEFEDETVSGGCQGRVIRTYNVIDECGNQTDFVQIITLTDATAPVVVEEPADLTVECSDQSWTYADVAFTDNCDDEILVEFAVEYMPSGCLGSYLATWTATDNCGNITSVDQVITVVDTENPFFDFVPASFTVECSEDFTLETPIASDLCSSAIVTIVTDTIQGACPSNYTIVRNFTATDNCGNTSEASQTIEVVDTTAPNWNFETATYELSFECNEIRTSVEPTANDACNAVEIMVNETIYYESPCYTSGAYIFVAVDACGNESAPFYQYFTVNDTQAPEFAQYSVEIERPCDDYMGIFVTATDNCNGAEISYTDEAVSGGCQGRIIRNYTAVDACGNESFAQQIITLTDAIDPTVAEQPMDMTIECGDEVPAFMPMFSDNCDDELSIEAASSTATEGCTETITRTWTATDNCGNSITIDQVITIVDTTAPVWNGEGYSETVSCGTAFTVAPGEVFELCNGYEISHNIETINGQCEAEYTEIHTFIATDACGNASLPYVVTVNYVDNNAPYFTFVPENGTTNCLDFDGIPMATASDSCSSVVVTFVESSVPFSQGGTVDCGQFRTASIGGWGASNGSAANYRDANFAAAFPNGLTVGCGANTFTFTSAQAIEDFLPAGGPSAVITGNAINPINISNQLAAQLVAAVLSLGFDTYDPNFAPSNGYLGDAIFASGAFEGMTVSQVVSAANQALGQCSNANLTQLADALAILNLNYDGVGVDNGNFECGGEIECGTMYTRVWTATDACGNFTTATTEVFVVDNTAPSFDDEVSNITVACVSDIPAFVDLTATDVCSEATVIRTEEVISSDDCGNQVIEISYIATDACGNQALTSYTITVLDEVAPTLSTTPENLVLACDAQIPAAEVVTASDNCGSEIEVGFIETIVGEQPAEGSIADCNLITPALPAGNPCNYPTAWAMALFNMPTSSRYYVIQSGELVRYPNGTAHVSATLVNAYNSNAGFNVSVWFDSEMDWSSWSNQNFPTSFKADCGGIDANYQDWLYFVLVNGEGAELTGWGEYAGSALNLSHAPSNKYFGFQLGDGANNYNAADNGFGGWFTYSGSFVNANSSAIQTVSGAGDFAFELDCCPEYQIVRCWTAMDCSGNMVEHCQTISFEGSDIIEVINPTTPESTEAEVSKESNVSVYPNPATDQANFVFSAVETGKATIDIYDLAGARVASIYTASVEAGNEYKTTFDAGTLATGVYTYRLTNGSTVEMGRLIISK